MECYKDFFVVEGREDGLDRIAIHRYDTPTVPQRIDFPEASYTAGLGDNPEYDVSTLRSVMSRWSRRAPSMIMTWHRRLTVLKVQEIHRAYDGDKYRTERLKIPARDGTMVPVSIVYPKDFPRDGSGKLFLYAYGVMAMRSRRAFRRGA